MSELLSQLLAETPLLTHAQFTAKYPHAFLLCESSKVSAAAPSRLQLISPVTSMVNSSRRIPELAPTTGSLRSRPDSYTLYPLAKTDRNPWGDRILVGRAKNNDIVLQNQSVSKVHAHFAKNGPRYTLAAYETLNPTIINGTTLAPNGPPGELPDGASLQFGNVHAYFYESATMFALLVGH